MALSGSEQTRLAPYAIPTQPYGSFSGKTTVAVDKLDVALSNTALTTLVLTNTALTGLVLSNTALTGLAVSNATKG